MISLSLVLLLVGFNAGAQDETSSRVNSLVRESQFIFQGTVAKLNSTTMPSSLPASDATVVVKVEEVIDAPASLGNFTGQEITVGLAKNSPVRSGQRLVFFTRGWLYGRSLAVSEVGRLEGGRNTAAIRRQVAEARQMISDENLSRRLARAEVVVVGTVTLVRPARERRRPSIITEHEPDWWEAVIEVETVMKGTLQSRSVVVLYANSNDVMWYGAPKFARGQRGVFLLHRPDAELQRQWQIQGLTALDPLDFQPPSEVERVKRLASNIR
ncbi:MAG TPA: hypothetical protein VGV59_06125 [Pyrinomonadaceae bacterium]|nr:hypothetical protein [Pyrinomonadaceae bacterium]